MEKALDYMGLLPHTPITDIKPDKIFIGSCTNARIEDYAPPPKFCAVKQFLLLFVKPWLFPAPVWCANKPKKKVYGMFF